MELWIPCAHGKNYVEVAWGSHQHIGSERRSCLDNFPGWRPNRLQKKFCFKKDHGKRLSQLWASSERRHTMTLWPININATKSREPWCRKVMPRMLRVARWKSMSRFASELRFAKIDSSGPSRWIRWHLAWHFTTKCISSNFGVIPFPNLIDSGHAMWLFKVISSD